MGKAPNMNWARNMDIDAWRERQISKRLKALLDERDRAFEEAHAEDTDAELREYVRRQAAALRRMPHPLELEGSGYLRERLGEWKTLALELGYRPASPVHGRRAYLRLRAKAEELFAEERRARKKAKKQLWLQRSENAAAFAADWENNQN